MDIVTLWDGTKALLGVTFIVLFLLMQAARRYPHVTWLQPFNIPDRRTEEQKSRARHTANVMGGLEMIGMGAAVPPLYLLSTVMFFNDPDPAILGGTILFSIVLIYLGVRTIVKSRHQ